MTQSQVQKKLRNLEAQIEALKRVFVRVPSAAVDERNWAQVKTAAKRSRKATFRTWYGKT